MLVRFCNHNNNPLMHNVVKWPNKLQKSCVVNNASFLKYVDDDDAHTSEWVSCRSPCLGSLILVCLYRVIVNSYIVYCKLQGGIPKLSNWVLLGVKYWCCITYCGCIKSGCPFSLRNYQSPIVNPLLTHCHSIFGAT